MKRFSALIISFLMIFSLSGCSIGQGGIDGLLTAPKLTEEQSEIHEALIRSVGSDISLKYPKSGENRSAFVVENIDNEPTDEAIVFYQYNDPENDTGTVMVEILDQNSKGEWQAVFEFPGAGPVVDQIGIKNLGYDDKPSIIIGYSTLNLEDKQFQIYSYSEGQMSSIYTDKYSIMHIIDLNGEGHNDIITISTDDETGKSTASLLRSVSGKIVAVDSVSMASGTSAYVSSAIGKTADGSSALFVDSTRSTGVIQTEVISYSYKKLQNPMATFSKKLMLKTARPSQYLSMDIDNDSVIEIPETVTAAGYEKYDKSNEDKQYFTIWKVYNDSYSLEKKYTGYYKISDGYAFMFPDNWQDKVTVKIDKETEETVFYKFNKSLAESNEELLRLNVIDVDDIGKYNEQGYRTVSSSNQIAYIAKISNTNDELGVNFDTIKSNLYLTD